jgi:hypothetical protein
LIRASYLGLRDNIQSSSAKESAMRLRTLLVSLVSVILLPSFSNAQVLKIVIDDTIQAATQERIERTIDQAAAEKDDAVLIELSTPGGVMDAMREIGQHRQAFSFSRALTSQPWRREPTPGRRIRSARSAATSRAPWGRKLKAMPPP